MCETENGTNGAAPHPAESRSSASWPYSQVQDYISQVGSYKYVYITILAISVNVSDADNM